MGRRHVQDAEERVAHFVDCKAGFDMGDPMDANEPAENRVSLVYGDRKTVRHVVVIGMLRAQAAKVFGQQFKVALHRPV